MVFALLSVWGWVTWSRRPAADHRVAVGRVPRRTASMLVLAGLVGTAVVTAALAVGTDSTTEVADAATTTGSIVAQIMLNRGWIESWYVWIAVDVAYIGLYAAKGLWLTGLLYLILIGLCVSGLHTWRRAPREPVATAVARR